MVGPKQQPSVQCIFLMIFHITTKPGNVCGSDTGEAGYVNVGQEVEGMGEVRGTQGVLLSGPCNQHPAKCS